MVNKVRQNMHSMAQYDKIVSLAYKGDDADRFKNLSRDWKLTAANLMRGIHNRIYAEIRKDLMTIAVSCISIFEEEFQFVWQDDDVMRDKWMHSRNEIFDRANNTLAKYKELLLDED